MAAAFPPIGVGAFALVAAWPLVLAARRRERLMRVAAGVLVGVVPMNVWFQWWAWEVSSAGMPVMVAYLSVYPALFVWLMGRSTLLVPRAPGWLLAAVLCVGVEMLKGQVVFHGYPWYLLGQPLVCLLWPVGATLGMYGGSLVVAVASLLALQVIESTGTRVKAGGAHGDGPARRGAIFGLVGMVVAVVALWFVAAPPGGGDLVRVAVVQTNVPQSNKMFGTFDERLADFSTALRLTSEAAHREPKPDFIVWPETMFPGTSLSPGVVEEERRSGLGYREKNFPLTGWHDELVQVQGDLGIPLVVGSIAVEGFKIFMEDQGPRFEQEKVFNSAFVINAGRVQRDRYDKVHLTPFGETMPYISAWKWLEQQLLAIGAAGMEFNLSEGESTAPLVVPGAGTSWRVAAPICFEATMPAVVRRLVFDGATRKADVMVNLTNDGWFTGSVGARENHLLAARWRCAELGTPMVRAANTGVSCVIDARGGVTHRGPTAEPGGGPDSTRGVRGAMVEGVMSAEVRLPPKDGRPTLYAVVGNVTGWLAMLGTLLLWAGAIAAGRRNG